MHIRVSVVVLVFFVGLCVGLPARISIPSDAGLLKGGYFQGDIAGFDPYEENDRSATVKLKELWPEGIVYYKIDYSMDEYRAEIREAMDEYEKKTCIRFRRATYLNEDYVNIVYMNGCWSKPGRRGGKQDLSLGDGCLYKGTILHELGHALGFFHEQSRSDRDDYLEVIWENIEKGQENQFIKQKYYDNNLLDEKFDYKSIMLYEETTFSKDGESPTMRVLKPGIVIGHVYDKYFLSEVDVRKINKLYQCNGMIRPPPPKVPDLFCDFDKDDCEMGNRYGSSSFHREFMTIGGRSGNVFVVTSMTAKEMMVGLETPIWHTYGNPEACFTFDYYMFGKGILEFNIFKGIERAKDIKEKSDTWKTISLPVYEKDGDVRFSFNGYVYKEDGYGVWALDNFSYKLSPCPKN